MTHARSGAAAMLLALAACAPAPALRQRDGRPVVSDLAVARAEAALARARLDSALRIGDVPRMFALLDESIVVVLPEGDSAVGRAAVARRLSERWDDARTAALHLFPGRAVLCMDGIVETAGDATIFVGRAQRADTISERVRVTYRNAGAGAWRITRAEFGQQRADNAPDRRSCPRVDDAVFAQRRFRMSASLPASLQTLPTKASAENQLRAEGYRIGAVPRRSAYSYPQTFDTPDGSIEHANGWVSARARLRGDWWGDVVVGYGSSRFSTVGYNAVAGSRVRADLAFGLTAALLVQREWRGFRLGAGPALLNSRWRLIEDRRDLVPQTVILDTSMHASSVAGMAELAWLRSLGDAGLLELRLWQRVGGSTPFPAFGTVVGGRAFRLDATSLFVGVGLAF